MNCFLTLPTTSCGVTLRTLKWTVLVSGLHSPMRTMSPSLTEKAGEIWAGMFLCLFSYLLYLGTQWRQSLLTTMVLCILVEMTMPLRILPRMVTPLVKGHFLSIQLDSMAYFGVLKLRPTCLQYLTPEPVFFASNFLLFKKTLSCFWKALSCYGKEMGYLDIGHVWWNINYNIQLSNILFTIGHSSRFVDLGGLLESTADYLFLLFWLGLGGGFWRWGFVEDLGALELGPLDDLVLRLVLGLLVLFVLREGDLFLLGGRRLLLFGGCWGWGASEEVVDLGDIADGLNGKGITCWLTCQLYFSFAWKYSSARCSMRSTLSVSQTYSLPPLPIRSRSTPPSFSRKMPSSAGCLSCGFLYSTTRMSSSDAIQLRQTLPQNQSIHSSALVTFSSSGVNTQFQQQTFLLLSQEQLLSNSNMQRPFFMAFTEFLSSPWVFSWVKRRVLAVLLLAISPRQQSRTVMSQQGTSILKQKMEKSQRIQKQRKAVAPRSMLISSATPKVLQGFAPSCGQAMVGFFLTMSMILLAKGELLATKSMNLFFPNFWMILKKSVNSSFSDLRSQSVSLLQQ